MDRPLSWLVLVCLLASVGCAGLSRLPPTGQPIHREILVFDDGFHSGLVLPKQDGLEALDPRKEGAAASLPFVEIGFGSDAWAAIEDPGCVFTTRLALLGGTGVLMCEHRSASTRPPRDDATPIRFWRLPLSAAGWQALVAAVQAEVDASVPALPRHPDRSFFLLPARNDWSLSRNCHCFTVTLLRRCGLPLAWRPWHSSAMLTRQLDAAMAELAAGGVAGVGPDGR